MMYRYHWGSVDGWFNPDMPSRSSIRPAPESILAWTQSSGAFPISRSSV